MDVEDLFRLLPASKEWGFQFLIGDDSGEELMPPANNDDEGNLGAAEGEARVDASRQQQQCRCTWWW